MSKKDTIIKGTFILTITGFLSRFIGFFYRIFLSRTFRAEGMGFYQLVFPIFALGFSLTSAGIEVALSRLVAQKCALGKQTEAKQSLFAGLLLSLSCSAIVMLLIQSNTRWIARYVLQDIRCAELLLPLSYIFPFASIHSCICGYYLGLKQTKRLAVSQLVEQTVRVLSVWFICACLIRNQKSLPVSIMVIGLVLGEIGAALYCVFTWNRTNSISGTKQNSKSHPFLRMRELLALSAPLTANRVLLNVLQSIEAVSIPASLLLYGLSGKEALSLYGILTGMAMPCIFFPSAITNSIATMLLPTIAEVQTQKDQQMLLHLIKRVSVCVFSLGCFCTAAFLIFGNCIGNLLFHSSAAGKFIITLAWICPFMYSNTTLISILNGLGKVSAAFLINTFGLCIRILSVYLLIPKFGILGYLWGLLGSQFLISVLALCTLKHYFSK